MTVAYALGADVVVDLTDGPGHGEVLHYGTVCKARDGKVGELYRVSGLPREWLPAGRLRLAARPPAEAS